MVVTFNQTAYQLRSGGNGAANLDVLLVALRTAQFQDGLRFIDADEDSLDKIENLKDDALFWINDAVRAFGILLAHVNKSELDLEVLNILGFSLAGLSDLQHTVQTSAFVIDESRQYLKELGIKKPA